MSIALRHYTATILLCLSLLITAHPISAKDEVMWMEAAMPPYFIKSGPFQGQGYGDVVAEIIREHLTGYNHETMTTNITRHFYAFKQGEKVCSIGLYRTPEREEFMHFSIPSFLTLPAVIIIKADQYQTFGGRPTVRLSDILANEDLVIGISKDRSYGVATDQVLHQYADQANVVEFTGQELSLNLFRMLMMNRLDGLIGLPEEALFQAEQLWVRDQLMTLTIEENSQDYDNWLSAVGCSKNEWGARIIAEINKILLSQRPSQLYRGAYERWLDSHSIATYREVYDRVFLESLE
ncbi:TIGR02285 family protein [Desulfobulbus alkaliphilus]|uniref:TIGR02285 family protein n=1 Tax=Desulfobulbus alkaliphilus TaxID=869814 RepID=UPI0019626965|nr:TIGR02285 family protein [Desulfobulbus alkaliphilus]MBM9537295.1 TIGR02285 family protein [Desulfobulbus alkaliphilus]